MEYYVYMMSNTHRNVLYTGITNDLVRRVYEHRNHLDKGSYTDRYNAERLVYYESTPDVRAAIEREKQIKGWNRKRKDKLVESKNPNWDDLYEMILYTRGLPRQCAHWLAMTSFTRGIATPARMLVCNDIIYEGDCHTSVRAGSQ